MSYEVYKILHLTGIILIFSGLVGLLTVKMSNGIVEGKTKSLIFMSHGIGLLLALVGGFGLLARLGLARDIPNWVFGKLAIWLILGGAIAIVKRKGQLGWPIFAGLILLFIAAAYLAILKPF
jgi:hypothetical protein